MRVPDYMESVAFVAQCNRENVRSFMVELVADQFGLSEEEVRREVEQVRHYQATEMKQEERADR